MLLDDLAQCWGCAGGLPGLRVGMSTTEARAVVDGHLYGGDLSFAVGDPTGGRGSPVALSGVVHPWREITFYAESQQDMDGSFWSGATLVADYLASELGAPRPRHKVGSRGQPRLRMRHRGLADGVPVDVDLSAEGYTEDGISLALSITPDRPWLDLIGDALGVGAALSEMVLAPEANGLVQGGTRALPAELDGSHIEVLYAVDGALRVRVCEGRASRSEWQSGSRALGNSGELLRRKSARQEDVGGLDHRCTVYHGLAGIGGLFEVRLAVRPAKGVLGELLIRAAAPR